MVCENNEEYRSQNCLFIDKQYFFMTTVVMIQQFSDSNNSNLDLYRGFL